MQLFLLFTRSHIFYDLQKTLKMRGSRKNDIVMS